MRHVVWALMAYPDMGTIHRLERGRYWFLRRAIARAAHAERSGLYLKVWVERRNY